MDLKEAKERIKVVEMGGASLKQLLQRSDPSKDLQCKDSQCWICKGGEGGQKKCLTGSCSSVNVGYVVTCITCQNRGVNKTYEGESGRSAKIRAVEHLRDIRLKKTTSALYQHVVEDHSEEAEPQFKFQIRQRFRDPLTRQVEEGVRIENVDDDCLLNTKSEWVPPALGRVRIT